MTKKSDNHLSEEDLLSAAEGESLPSDVKRHIDSCAVCAQEIADLQQMRALARDVTEPCLSSRLRQDLLQTYRSKKHRTPRMVRSILSWRIPVYQAACLVIGAILTWEIVTPGPKASHSRGDFREEPPAFTAALPEFAIGHSGMEVGGVVSIPSNQRRGAISAPSGPRREALPWREPAPLPRPMIDSSDVDANPHFG